MVSFKTVIGLCMAATASVSTAQWVIPASEMISQVSVIESLPITALDSTAVLDPPQDPTASTPIQFQKRSYPTSSIADGPTFVTETPVLSVVPAVNPSEATAEAVDPSSHLPGSKPPPRLTENASAAAFPAASVARETIPQAIILAEPSPIPASSVQTKEPTPTVTEVTPTVTPVPTRTPTMAPVVTSARPMNRSRATNGTKIAGNGRLKLGVNVTVDGAGNVRLGVKGRLQGNGTLHTKSGNLYKAGGQVQGEADVDTGINIGPRPKGGVKYIGGLDVGGGFEAEKPTKSSADIRTAEPLSTTSTSPDVRSNNDFAPTPTVTESRASVPRASEPTAPLMADLNGAPIATEGGAATVDAARGSGSLPSQNSL